MLNAAPSWETGTSFDDIEGKEWILLEVKNAGETIVMDRQKLQAQGLGGVYTIQFQEGRISGMGSPNRYFGPYTVGNNRALTIGDVASTMMFSFIQPDGLSESEYFALLSNTARWDLRGELLELYSLNSDGAEVVLVFAQLDGI